MAADINQLMTSDGGAVHWIDPWHGHPKPCSRLAGLGGTGIAADPALVFETDGLVFTEGEVVLSITVFGFDGITSFMFLDLANYTTLVRNPSIRLQLQPFALVSGNAAQTAELRFTAYSGIGYQLAGFIHGNHPVTADAIEIVSSAAFYVARADPTPAVDVIQALVGKAEIEPRTTSQIYDWSAPEFDQIQSQPFSACQLLEPAFAHCKTRLFGDREMATEAHWPEAFVMRAAQVYADLSASRRVIGFNAAAGAIWRYLLAERHEIVLAERGHEPEQCYNLGEARAALLAGSDIVATARNCLQYTVLGENLPEGLRGRFDMSWWIVENLDDWRASKIGLANMVDSLAIGGLGIAVFPVAFNSVRRAGALCAKSDLPRILIELISCGLRIVQVRLSAERDRLEPATAMFGLIFQQSAPAGQGAISEQE